MGESVAVTFGSAGAAWAVAAAGAAFAAAAIAGLIRQRAALLRLDDRVTHLTAAVSLLTSTTEEGWRSVAAELARRVDVPRQAAPAAEAPAAPAPVPQPTLRERIATAAAHGRSVRDIAAAEQVSEGEVLLHLLVQKMHVDERHAEVC